MRRVIVIFLGMMLWASVGHAQTSLHDFTVETIDGESFDLSQLEGKKVLVVNTASKCGLTPQYEGLQELYETYKDEGFVVIGFPANNFLNQEPGSNADIKEFCTSSYGVSFPMMAKISVKGKDMHPLYQWLTQKEKNGKEDAPVKWNFQKFMIDENGQWVDVARPKVKPDAAQITDWIAG